MFRCRNIIHNFNHTRAHLAHVHEEDEKEATARRRHSERSSQLHGQGMQGERLLIE